MLMSNSVNDIDLGRAAAAIRGGNVIVLTGAGISVDSGIPDFRSAGGLWTKFPIEEFATIEAFQADPRKVWRLFSEVTGTLRAAKPNVAHDALARLERAGKILGIVTQNIDSLHQNAGSRVVVEYHGTVSRMACLACGKKHEHDKVPAWEEPAGELPRIPLCACGAVLKPDIVMFGEAIPYDCVRASRRLVEQAACCIVAGTSALVHPAAAIPEHAANNGAKVIEINLRETPLTERVTNIFLKGSTSEILPALADRALAS